jgi:conjugal transfer mating pair stabilization protein TraN
MYDSVASMLGEAIGTNLSIEAIKLQAMQGMSNWVVSHFGAGAGQALFSYAAGSAPVTNAATGGMIEQGTVTGMGQMLSSIINVVGIIYAIYNIAKMVVQLIFACTEEETKLNMLKSQKLCTAPTEIGTYCSADMLGICVARKEAYCCFSSPFARIFQEQARPQLGKSFGDPKAPTCEGLKVNDITQLDFNKMDFSEWIDMLKIANQLPGDSLIADDMYDKANVTKGKLPNTATNNAQDRLKKQTEGSDIDAIRQHLLDNL